MRFILAALTAAFLTAPASAQQVVPLRFAPGASGTVVNGNVAGYAFRDYRLVLSAGQMLDVSLTPLGGSPYFNILEPGQSDVAVFIGSSAGNRASLRTVMAGAYTIRVYQMRATARRGAVASYRLAVRATGGGMTSHPSAPAHRPGDALVAGTPYHATSLIRCRSMPGAPMGSCKAGVIRRPGSATVHLDTPDGGERTILFRDGRAVGSDSDRPIRVIREGDTSIVTIGTGERYEIPDAVPFGG